MRIGKIHFLLVVLIGLTNCAKTSSGINKASGGQSEVVAGTLEPDYRYPWVVRNDGAGCSGVLIDPRWLLTAAHCATEGRSENTWRYTRTDPYTGTLYQDERGPAGVGTSTNPGAYVHPEWDHFSSFHDIALIHQAKPFAIDRFIQTAALPTTPRQANLIGTVANAEIQGGVVPPGQIAIFRAPIAPDPVAASAYSFSIVSTAASGSLCPGDSGSGFVTYENGRAIVRGIVSSGNSTECVTAVGHILDFADVYAHLDWILQTMRTVDYRLSGNTRVRWQGNATRGLMGLGCDNPSGTMWGPLDVVGVELGANCAPGDQQSVVCTLGPGQLTTAIIGFTMKTTCAPHGT